MDPAIPWSGYKLRNSREIVLATHHHNHGASTYPVFHERDALHYALIPCEHTFYGELFAKMIIKLYSENIPALLYVYGIKVP